MEGDEEIQRLGRTIRAIRENMGISRTDLASDCKLDLRNIQRIEDGEGNPTFATLVKIAKALEVDFSSFFK